MLGAGRRFDGSISRSSGSPRCLSLSGARVISDLGTDFMAVVRRFRSGLLRPLGPHLATPGYRPSTSTSDKRYLRCLLSICTATGGEDHEWPVESVDLKANRYANAMPIDFASSEEHRAIIYLFVSFVKPIIICAHVDF